VRDDRGVTDRFHVVTGGPGAGKTTLLAALHALGHNVTGDAARALVRADPRVRDDDVAFQLAILANEVAAYAAASGTTWFDRAVPDVAAAFRLLGRPVPPDVEAAVRAHPYDSTVYVAPPWREIFVNDAERVQTFDHAVAVHDAIVATYRDHGYDVVELPKAPVDERVAFVLGAATR
jgi:predicted ATPase